MPTKRWALIGLAIGGAIAGLALGWDWIVAAGMAPLVVSVLPCVAMCALGLCAMRGNAKPCHGGDKAEPKAADRQANPPLVQREP